MKQSLMIDKLKEAKDSLEKYKDSKSEEQLDDAYNLIIQTIAHYDKILSRYYKYY
jgi:hypothetical protein